MRSPPPTTTHYAPASCGRGRTCRRRTRAPASRPGAPAPRRGRPAWGGGGGGGAGGGGGVRGSVGGRRRLRGVGDRCRCRWPPTHLRRLLRLRQVVRVLPRRSAGEVGGGVAQRSARAVSGRAAREGCRRRRRRAQHTGATEHTRLAPPGGPAGGGPPLPPPPLSLNLASSDMVTPCPAICAARRAGVVRGRPDRRWPVDGGPRQPRRADRESRRPPPAAELHAQRDSHTHPLPCDRHAWT